MSRNDVMRVVPAVRAPISDRHESVFHFPLHRTWREKVKNYAFTFFSSSSLIAVMEFSRLAATKLSRLTEMPISLSTIGVVATEYIALQLLSKRNGSLHSLNFQENTPKFIASWCGCIVGSLSTASLVQTAVVSGIASTVFFECFVRAKGFFSQSITLPAPVTQRR